MNAKRNGAASGKSASKSKRSSAAGTGFSKKDAKQPSANGKATASVQDDDEEMRTDMEVERTSGAQGDATPHRARVAVPTSAQMENPEEDILNAPLPPLVQLPELTPERKAELQFDRSEKLDTLIEWFADAHKSDDFGAIIVANRDMITERLLYRFTSAILQVECRTADVEMKMEEAANMRELRKDLIAYCWSLDYPLKVELQAAETRLLNVLKGSTVKQDVAQNCGRTTLEVDAFWIVIFAAVAAWEERGRENPELANVDMQKALAAAADACNTVDEVTTRLSPALKAVQKILTSTDPQIQADVVNNLDDETVAQMGTFTEQIRLFPTAAYGALCSRMGSIVDYIQTVRYGIAVEPITPFRFEVVPMPRTSRLVEFSDRSRKMRGNARP